MTPAGTSARRPLGPQESAKIFRETILPSILTGNRPAENKTVAFVCGQPGAGKSTMVRQLKDRFGGEYTISLSADDFYCGLPGLNDARMGGEPWGSGLEHEQETVRAWNGLASKYGERNNCHFIYESCRDPSVMARYLNNKGYSCEAYIIATNRYISLTSMFKRAVDGFKKGSMANCAVLDKGSHDNLYAQWPKIAFEIERNNLFSRLAISTRDAGEWYENTLLDRASGQWAKAGRAHEKLVELNNRHFSPAQIDALDAAWSETLHSDLTKGQEFRSYPLEQYRDEVMSYARSPGRGFDARLVLPQDRLEARKSYIADLFDDVCLITDSLDASGDDAVRAELYKVCRKIGALTQRRVDVGKKMLADINEAIASEKSEASEFRTPVRQTGDNTRPAHSNTRGINEHGDGNDIAQAKQPVVRLGMRASSSASSDYGSLDLTEAEAVELESNALKANGKRHISGLEHIQGGMEERVGIAKRGMEDNTPPPAKRARYDARPADLGRGG